MKLFAVMAKHTPTQTEVCFLVVADTSEKAGWPLLNVYKDLHQSFLQSRIQYIAEAPGRTFEVIGYFGPPELEPKRKNS